MLAQDLHVHTTCSTGDSSVVPEQTVALVAAVAHARVIGISDHFEFLADGRFDDYAREVRAAGLRVGVEVNGHDWVDAAIDVPSEYYIYHCYDHSADYRALDRLLETNRPVVVAHPNALDTRLARVSPECCVEINNRYVWRCDWRQFYGPFVGRFDFILSSDAHQPNWLNQTFASFVARELGIREKLLLED